MLFCSIYISSLISHHLVVPTILTHLSLELSVILCCRKVILSPPPITKNLKKGYFVTWDDISILEFDRF